MTLRLVVGRANIGKTGKAFDAVRLSHAAGGKPVLVLPSLPDVRRAADELADSDSLGFRVLTFDAFLQDAWDRAGDGRSIVRGSTRRLLAIAAARKAGAGSGIGELAAACVTTLAEQRGEAWREVQHSATGTGACLISTIDHYRESLLRLGLVEREEAAFILAETDSVPGDPLVVHRFIDFTPWQERLILGAARTQEVLVTLTWEEAFAPTRALNGLVERLAATVTVADGEPFHTEPELAAVADGLFSVPTKVSPSGCIRFALAEGHEAEAHRIADEVQLALANNVSVGRPVSVAVVFRQPERHYRYLREAFDEAGVLAEYDVRLPLGATSFGSAVLATIQFALSGERDLLLSVLKSPFGGGDRGLTLALERDWRKRGIRSPITLIDDLWRVSKDLQSVMRGVKRLTSRNMDASAARLLADEIGRLFILGYGRGESVVATDGDDALAHAAVQRVLSEVATIDDSTILLKDVADSLRRSIVTSNVEERPGYVQVTAVDRIRGRRYDTVIIGGLNADEFPAVPSENMLPGSSVAEVLNAFGGVGETQNGADYEQLVFYIALTRAQRRVVLSARTADSDGDPAALSPLFETVADSYRPEDDEDGRPPAEFRALSQIPRSTDLATARESLRERAYCQSDDPRSLAARWRSRSRIARLNEDASLERLLRCDTFSPSALDAYLECPYRWFYSRAVHPERLESGFDESAQGSFAHQVLARAYTALRESGIERITPDTVDKGHAAVQAAWEAVNADYGAPGTVLEKSERHATLGWADRIVEHDASFAVGFSPNVLEWSFGFGDDDAIDMGGFKLRGIVDRVDSDSAGRAIVIDYKRSGGPSAANILKKRKIQVPLYFEAVRKGLGLEPVAGLYRGVRVCEDRGLVLETAAISGCFKSTDVMAQVEFSDIVEGALELARAAVEGMRSGRIDQKPFDSATCAKCEAFAVCGGSR